MPRSLRVLYVDDEPGLLEIGKMFLENTGDFSVTTIDSATSALSHLITEQFDAIISDYQMPGMDGIQFLKAVRNSGNEIPFILFTGKGREDVVIQALNEGADFYLQKGGDPQAQFAELTHKIKMAIYRKWAEKALNQSEERFRSVMNQLPGTVWAVDRDLRFTLSQGAGLVKIGLKPDQVVGKSLYEFFNTSDPAHMEISHHLRALTGEQTVYDYTHEGISFRTYLSPLYDAHGTITGVTGLAFDITEQKRTEEALQESEKRYRNVVEDQTELISRFLPDGTHIFVNEAYCRYFGFVRNDILGHRFRPKIQSEDQERINQFFRSLTRDNPVGTIEHRIIMPDGTIRWQRWSDRAIFDASGMVTEYQSVGRDVTEIKEAEEEIRKSERKFRLLFDNAILGLFQTTPEGRYLNMNPAFARIYGYDSPEEMIAAIHDIQEQLYVNPEVRQLFKQSLSVAGEVRNFEMQNWHRDGHAIWITTNARVIRDTSGKIVAFEGTIEDITERKWVEQELRKSEETLSAMLNGIIESAFLMLIDGTILAANETAARRLGFARGEDIVGLNIYALLPREFCEDRKSKVQEVLRSGKMVQYENATAGKVFNNILNPVIDPDGKIRRLAILGQNITERKQAEEALQENEAKFKDFFNNAGDAIAIHDMQGHFLEVNDEICRRLGYSREELLNMSPGDIDEPEYGNKVQARIQELEQTGHIVFETAHHAKHGTRIPTEVSSRVIVYNGEPAIISNARDITERKQAETALKKVNRQLNILSSITRHDILNKIMVVLGFLQITEMEVKDPEMAEYLQKIHSGITAIQSQIEFTRVYQDLGTHEPQWTDLDTIIPRQLVPSTITLLADTKGIQIFSDPMFEKVFFNLLDNSIRHGERVNEIQISFHPSGVDLVVVWEDNGVGIANSEKEQIFELGFGKNTGFGLFLAREILSLTGITMKETGEPGKGARFEMTVPKGMWRIVP